MTHPRSARSLVATAVLVLTTSLGVLGITQATPAGATHLKATVLSPINGRITSNPAEPHHRPWAGDYSLDIGGTGAVHARFANPSADLRLTMEGTFEPCAAPNQGRGGIGVLIGVTVGGVRLGWVRYVHLASVAVSNGVIPNGAHIGTVATGLPVTSCWTGAHVHVEVRNDSRYACWVSRGLGTTVSTDTHLGTIGGEYASTVNTACPPGATDPTTPPTADGAFIRTPDGTVYRLVGGAPVYVSSWAPFGGSQPVTAVASVAGYPTYPADGSLVHAGGHVYVIAGGAPIYVSSWSAIGGERPAIGIDPAAITNAGAGGVWNHLRQYPVDGTLVNTAPRVSVIAGGAPIYVSSWDAIGGSRPSTRIDPAAVTNAGAGGVWNHLRQQPADGTRVRDHRYGSWWIFRAGLRSQVSAGPGVLVDYEGLRYITLDHNFVAIQMVDFGNRPPGVEETERGKSQLAAGTTPAALALRYVDNERYSRALPPVARLYWAYFRRSPDYAGLSYWRGRHHTGASLDAISRSFSASAEFQRLYGSLGNEAFVRLVYRNVLDRSPDAAGLRFWVGRLQAGVSRGKVMTGFSESSEYKSKMAGAVGTVQLWTSMLRRMPTDAEIATWRSRSRTALVDWIRFRREYQERIGW